MLNAEEMEKVRSFLKDIKGILATGDFRIEKKEKNKWFDDEYNLSRDEKKEIILALTVDDCNKIEKNNNKRYPDTDEYFFLKDVSLFSYGEEEAVQLYIKMHILQLPTHDMLVVISFHKAGLYD